MVKSGVHILAVGGKEGQQQVMAKQGNHILAVGRKEGQRQGKKVSSKSWKWAITYSLSTGQSRKDVSGKFRRNKVTTYWLWERQKVNDKSWQNRAITYSLRAGQSRRKVSSKSWRNKAITYYLREGKKEGKKDHVAGGRAKAKGDQQQVMVKQGVHILAVGGKKVSRVMAKQGDLIQRQVIASQGDHVSVGRANVKGDQRQLMANKAIKYWLWEGKKGKVEKRVKAKGDQQNIMAKQSDSILSVGGREGHRQVMAKESDHIQAVSGQSGKEIRAKSGPKRAVTYVLTRQRMFYDVSGLRFDNSLTAVTTTLA
ncbi:hypothetical protein B0H13DRAFT_1896142 [Mycena leptocephala]|nr:hypothetical protein B0H13DRAFT_1896142 [Mycena leptocephala]